VAAAEEPTRASVCAKIGTARSLAAVPPERAWHLHVRSQRSLIGIQTSNPPIPVAELNSSL
jgi:hypothetical protein